MIIEITRTFNKDVDKINDKKIISHILNIIELMRISESISIIPNLKKLKGYNNFYRISIGNYRLGFEYIEEEKKFILIRFLHRKEIYRYFPK